MPKLPKNYVVVPASSLGGSIITAEPMPLLQAIESVQHWLTRQDKFWPQELTTDILTRDMLCVYFAHWIVNAEGSATWGALIGTDKEEIKACLSCEKGGARRSSDGSFVECQSCSGKGYTIEKRTEWTNQSGVASCKLRDRLVPNITNPVPIRCGDRAMANIFILSQEKKSNMLILQPGSFENSSWMRVVDMHIKEDANIQASKLGRVKELKVGVPSINGKASILLYPIFLSSYEYEEATHVVEVDGITGNVYVEVPESVRNKRLASMVKKLLVIAAMIIASIYGIWLLYFN